MVCLYLVAVIPFLVQVSALNIRENWDKATKVVPTITAPIITSSTPPLAGCPTGTVTVTDITYEGVVTDSSVLGSAQPTQIISSALALDKRYTAPGPYNPPSGFLDLPSGTPSFIIISETESSGSGITITDSSSGPVITISSTSGPITITEKAPHPDITSSAYGKPPYPPKAGKSYSKAPKSCAALPTVTVHETRAWPTAASTSTAVVSGTVGEDAALGQVKDTSGATGVAVWGGMSVAIGAVTLISALL
ncbi:hypothetical protein FA15DRAFT_669146 [Coprinopsis marcescibilis]|uniref:Uncharacterized protein n=1 Tax=Coprinopsis marcescibilis TaxID=230819 RepID=A0A5C3KWL1_COPMA|nr:hypothetical protein FA15DRAFT_669146 [Coprinopsis marcescibilis]